MQLDLLNSIADVLSLNNCLVCKGTCKSKLCSKKCLIRYQYLNLSKK